MTWTRRYTKNKVVQGQMWAATERHGRVVAEAQAKHISGHSAVRKAEVSCKEQKMLNEEREDCVERQVSREAERRRQHEGVNDCSCLDGWREKSVVSGRSVVEKSSTPSEVQRRRTTPSYT